MSTSYSGNPSSSDMDWARFEIQDTGPSYCGEPWRFQNEEILSKLTEYPDRRLAASELLLIWARLIGHNPNFTIGRFSEDYNAAAKFLEEKAKELKAAALGHMTKIYAGGILVSDKASKAANTNRTVGSFSRGQFDNPDAGGS